MKRMQIWPIAIALLGVISSADARELQLELIVDSVEDLYAYEERGELTQADVEILGRLLIDPVELNRADRDALFELPGVTELLAAAIVRYRKSHGDFRGVDDLLRVPGMQEPVYAQILPFVAVGREEPRPPVSSTEAPTVTGALRTGIQYRGAAIAPKRSAAANASAERRRGPQAYLQFEGQGFGEIEIGALLTYRQGISVEFDPTAFDIGSYVSADGPREHVRLDQVYLAGRPGRVDVILGSFNAGFGERLTFNTSPHQRPLGASPNVAVTADNARGTVRPRDRLFGAALHYDGFRLDQDAWLEATVFASSNVLDLYQGDFTYGGPASAPCERDIRVAGTRLFRCQELATDDVRESPLRRSETADFVLDGRLRSQRIYDANALGDESRGGLPTSYRFQQIRRAYRENIVGGNIVAHLSDAFRWGVTAYVGQARFRLDDAGQPNFADSNRLGIPRLELGNYGAAGTFVRFMGSNFDFGAEYAYSFAAGGGHGALLRLNAQPFERLEVQTLARVYGARFINPRANPSAAPDRAFGLAARNERGVELRATARPWRGLRLRVTVDYWQNPDHVFATPKGVMRVPRREPLDDLALDQRIELTATARERIFVSARFRDRVVRSLSLNETRYADGGDTCAPDIVRSDPSAGGRVSDCATGKRKQLSLGLMTDRLPGLSVYGRVERIWQDDGAVRGGGEASESSEPVKSSAYRLSFRVRARLWNGASAVVSTSWRPQRVFGFGADDETEFFLQDSAARWFSHVEVRQQLGPRWRLSARYGVQDFARDDPDRSRYFQIGRVAAVYHF